MVRPIIKDPIFLSRKSAPAGLSDLPVAMDLLETLPYFEHFMPYLRRLVVGCPQRVVSEIKASAAPVLLLLHGFD